MNQLAAIHIKKTQLGLDDETYRALLERVTGKRSAKDLSASQRFTVITELERLGAPRHRTKTALEGRYAPVLRALWLTGYNLGIVNDRRDSALIAFVNRQTGIAHTAWLREQRDAARAIEGLKKWIEREGALSLVDKDPLDRKRAVIKAQAAILGTDIRTLLPLETGAALDEMISVLGKRIRQAKRTEMGHAQT